ncbi:LamG domain-containing protein [Candidatus Poribacteria bacterium]|nr:LamG domain-containing protein [Candidatus Poribacteria bacterium]
MKKFICLFTTMIFVVCGTIAFAANPAEDTIFHFPFDEGNGDTTADISANKFKGTINNAEWVEGVVGQALQFNNGAVTVPAFGVDEPAEMTIELWFKPTEKIAGGDRIDIMYRGNGGGRPHLTFNRGGILFGCYVATKAKEFQVVSTYNAFEPQWYYLVLTQDKDKAIMYIDGKKDGEADSGGDVRMDFGVHGMSIGANTGGSNFFNGTIDEVKMWSVALTAEDVKKNMDQALAVEAYNKLAITWGKIKSRD